MALTGREEEMISIARRVYDAFNRGDFDGAASVADEEFELHRVGGLETIRGRDALRAWMEPDVYEESLFEPKEFRVNGNALFVRGHVYARASGSGIELDAEGYAVWTFDDDLRLLRVEQFTANEQEAALGTTGLED